MAVAAKVSCLCHVQYLIYEVKKSKFGVIFDRF